MGTTSGGDSNCRGKGYYNRLDGAFADWLRAKGVDDSERTRHCANDDACDGICFADPDCDEFMLSLIHI